MIHKTSAESSKSTEDGEIRMQSFDLELFANDEQFDSEGWSDRIGHKEKERQYWRKNWHWSYTKETRGQKPDPALESES